MKNIIAICTKERGEEHLFLEKRVYSADNTSICVHPVEKLVSGGSGKASRQFEEERDTLESHLQRRKCLGSGP